MLTMDATGLDKPTPQLIQAITNNLDVLRMRSWLLFTDQAPAFVLPRYPGV